MKSIVLIGMSGVGKSFLGKRLAERISFAFVDTDLLIEERHHLKLPEVLEAIGEDCFLQEEAKIVSNVLDRESAVIAPGGSVVYVDATMKKASGTATVIYLKGDASNILERIDPNTRGIVGLSDKNFQELYNERDTLYTMYAHHIVFVDAKTPDEVIDEIVSLNVI